MDEAELLARIQRELEVVIVSFLSFLDLRRIEASSRVLHRRLDSVPGRCGNLDVEDDLGPGVRRQVVLEDFSAVVLEPCPFSLIILFFCGVHRPCFELIEQIAVIWFERRWRTEGWTRNISWTRRCWWDTLWSRWWTRWTSWTRRWRWGTLWSRWWTRWTSWTRRWNNKSARDGSLAQALPCWPPYFSEE